MRLTLLLPMLCLVTGCHTPVVPAWALPEGVSTVPVNGYPMAYVSRGSGPALVLIHGGLSDYRTWQPQLEGLSSDYRVIAVSLRHFYPERWNGKGETFTYRQHADDVAKFIEALGGAVHVAGRSYGGQVAVDLALRRPELVKKLVLAEPPLDHLVSAEQARQQRERGDETARLLESQGIDAGLAYAMDAINGPGAWARRSEADRVLLRDNAWTVVGSGRNIDAQKVSCSEFGSLRMPVLLVTGANTAPRFQRIMQEQARCLPKAQTATIPAAGHGSSSQNPAAFNRAVVDFLER